MGDVYALLMRGGHLPETLAVCRQRADLAGLVVAAREDEVGEVEALLAGLTGVKATGVVLAGARRDESIHRGLLFLHEHCTDEDIVMLHDADERPLTAAALDRTIQAAQASGSVVTVESLAGDLAILKGNGQGVDLPPPGSVGRLTFPQAFAFARIWPLYEWAFGVAAGAIGAPYRWCLARLKPTVLSEEEL